MSRTLNDLWAEAKTHNDSINLNFRGEEARLLSGCKIKHDTTTGDIVIVNTTVGGNYYRPLDEEEKHILMDNGWICGSYVLSLSNLRNKLSKIERLIHEQVNGKNNPKHLSKLKNSRLKALNDYKLITDKLKSLNYEH